MAVSVAIETNRALRIIAPVIDFSKFRKYRYEEKICPVCGKSFKVRLEMFNASPEQGKHCSARCRWKANQKSLSALITEQEFKDFLELHRERVHKACNMAPLLAYKDPNAKWEDCYQECCIALFLLMARCKRQGRNYNNISEGSVFFQLKQAIKMSRVERRRWYNHNEEACYEEFNESNGINLELNYETDIGNSIDVSNMLEKVVQLAKEYPDVGMALAKAYLYRQPKDEQACKYIKEKYDIKTYGQYDWHITKGIEHIYYNDKENFDNFIDINNLSAQFAFNSKNPKVRPKAFDTWGTDEILSYYTGVKTCAYCSKKFKANKDQKHKEVAYCSKSCAKEARNAYMRSWKKSNREKMANR